MNYDLLSELLLCAVALFITWRELKTRPGIAVATLLRGVAALLGALIFAGISQAHGPLEFVSLLAGSAALPLLALSLGWPDGALASRIRASVSFFLVASALCLWMVEVLQLAPWRLCIPALASLVILFGAIRSKRPAAMLGALVLLLCFTLSLLQIAIEPLNSDQQLHVLMALALLLLTRRASR